MGIVKLDKTANSDDLDKLKKRFENKIDTVTTIAEVKKCLKILCRATFNQPDGE